KKRCLELSDPINAGVFERLKVPDTFFWAKPSRAGNAAMHIRILDLDGSALSQPRVRSQSVVHPAQDWGPHVRMACSLGRFRRFERELAGWLTDPKDGEPSITFIGSGDFHHVSLSLIRRLQEPFNLLIIDNHPDWMRGVPFMHCGTWLWHAARLPNVQRVFHVGGNVDFDNRFRWLAPWSLLRSGKVTVCPAFRRYQTGRWRRVLQEPLRTRLEMQASEGRLEDLVRVFRYDLWR